MWIEKYQYFLCIADKMRPGWGGGETQISLLICNTFISMCLKMFIGWSVRLEQVHTHNKLLYFQSAGPWF